MNEINKKINKISDSWYHKWHDSKYHVLIHWGVFLLIILVVWSFLDGRIWTWVQGATQPAVSVHLSPANKAQLSLDPQTEVIKVGDTFAVNIILDTGNGQVDGVDVYALHYDPSLLQVMDDMPKQSGIQITPGQILPLKAANVVETKTGNIKFAQVANGGTSFNGRGILGTIHFKALASGTSYLNFDFTKGSTTDSNVAFKGKDHLDKVIDGIYTIEPK